MKARDIDKKFEEGQEDIVNDLDLSSARRVNQELKSIKVDLPTWVLESLEREAALIGVNRQAIIEVWLVERLQEEASRKQIDNDTRN